jgi:FMN phosphatase YigB (HAD superfamily)/glycosyltransferase involved in cell wall biosynthesis
MKLAVVHYHLGHGGVGEVIRIVSRELGKRGLAHVVLSDGTAPESNDIPWRHVPGLGYRTDGDDESLHLALVSAAAEALGGRPDFWWIHNHSLGKNPALGRVVRRMSQQGEAMLLQLHDLAEDGRPENAEGFHRCPEPYPIGPRVRYLFCNQRDRSAFLACGMPEDCAVVLSNPIERNTTVPLAASGPARVFAPVRGIRRKNLGEILLLSRFSPPGTTWAISRRPENPREQAIHDAWADVSAELCLPITFDAASRADFDGLVSQATHFLSTSIAEGFGRSFLEAFAKGRGLLGRDIPHLTNEIRKNGFEPKSLYQGIRIPSEWLPRGLHETYQHDACELHDRAWKLQSPQGGVGTADGIDFADLPESLQLDVILRCGREDARRQVSVRLRDSCMPLADWLQDALQRRPAVIPGDALGPWAVETVVDQLLLQAARAVSGVGAAHESLEPHTVLQCFTKRIRMLQAPPLHHRPEIDLTRFRALVFDLYGTLLGGKAGGVRHDPAADPVLRETIQSFGHVPPDSPSLAITRQVAHEHAGSVEEYPEVDLRESWRLVLGADPTHDLTKMIASLQQAWMPVDLLDGVAAMLDRLGAMPLRLGMLSNAQCDALAHLGRQAELFSPELTMLSCQFGCAKPSANLFKTMRDRLMESGIPPERVLFIGNDPLHDIRPARNVGFSTALYIGHPDSLRPGVSFPDYLIPNWNAFGMPLVHASDAWD